MYWGEVIKISKKFTLGDHILNLLIQLKKKKRATTSLPAYQQSGRPQHSAGPISYFA